MIYHVGSQRFEKVEIIDSESREVLGNAEFQIEERGGRRNVAASPPARLSAAAAAAQAIAPKAASGAGGPAVAKKRNKSAKVATKQKPIVARQAQAALEGKIFLNR